MRQSLYRKRLVLSTSEQKCKRRPTNVEEEEGGAGRAASAAALPAASAASAAAARGGGARLLREGETMRGAKLTRLTKFKEVELRGPWPPY